MQIWQRRGKKVESNQAKCVGFKMLRLLGGSLVLFNFNYGIVDRDSIIINGVAFKFKTKEENIYISFVKLPIFRNFVNFLQGMTPIYNIILKHLSFLLGSSIFRPHSNSISNLFRITEIITAEIHYEITKCVERHVTTQQRWQWDNAGARKIVCEPREISSFWWLSNFTHSSRIDTFPLSISTATTTIFRVSLHVASLLKLCNAISLMDYSL